MFVKMFARNGFKQLISKSSFNLARIAVEMFEYE